MDQCCAGPVLYGQSGSGSPQTDFDMQLNVDTSGTAGTGWEAGATYLLSNRTAVGDFTSWNYPADDFNYPGMFWPNNYSPGIPNTPANYTGNDDMQLFFWTGDYNSYAAAEASHTPGVYAGESTVFVGYLLPPGPYAWLNNMPAVVMTQVPVPEPSTAALLAAAVAGLFGYAWWRKWR